MNEFELEDLHDCGLIKKRPMDIVKGKGAVLWNSSGEEFLDFGASYGVCNIGHCNEKVVNAIRNQSEKLLYVYGFFYNPVRARFMQKLTSLFPENLSKAFLCNSGTESVEAALKFARASTKKQEIVACMKGFHGKSFGALSATFKKDFKQPFEPLVPGFSHVAFNNIKALEKAVTEKTAAFIVEPIQGEGGVYSADKDYLKEARRICEENNALLIIDEIQTGFCRTGKMFGFEHYNIEPDIVCTAKSLAGGFPMGATITSNEVLANLPVLSHSSTFGGNPLACAAGISSIDFLLEESIAEKTEKKGDYLLKRLNEVNSDKIRETRGKGLMVGIQLKEKAGPYITELMKEKVLATSAGKTVIRLLPPLVVSIEQIDFAVEKIEKALK